MRRWFASFVDRIKREAVGFFTLPRDNDGTDALEGSDLPVDVVHFRLEKCRAVKCNDRRGGRNVQRSTLNVQRRKSNVEHQTSKIDCEELDALPFSSFRIEDNAPCRRAVSCRRLRIQHLQRISAADGARNHSVDILTVDWWRRWGSCRPFALDRRFQGLPTGGGNERDHQDRPA